MEYTTKRDNRGLSLVELLVAMSIMAVLGAMLFIGLGVIPRTNAKACANGLKTVIGQARVQTMGKRETVLELYRKNTDDKFYTVMNVGDGSGTLAPMQEELCGKSTVKISYRLAGGTDYTELADGEKWVISFDRGTGKVLKCGLSTQNTSLDPTKNTLCDSVLVEGGGISYVINIYLATGKITMDRL